MFDFFKKAKGILGINARNLNYVSKYNSLEAKKFADNKLYTKQFLQSRKIGVAKLYKVIKSYHELKNINLKTLPSNMVIKPNRGYGGEGILVINKKSNDRFWSIDGTAYSIDELYYHCVDILDGKYAISGTYDQVIIEELLEAHEIFNNVIRDGLPDIRIIVFNYTPIIAMLRVPTKESQGKANLHLGAIGVGIDIGTGKTTYGIHHNRYIRKFPNGDAINSLTIPFWDEILLTASQIQQVSKIGYLAVDLALTKNGIKILEVNARAGLSVQIANRAFLKKRLEKVVDLKVINPKQGVEIAKTLFSSNIPLKQEIKLKPVIGLFESVTLLTDKNIEIIARINPFGANNLIDKNIIKTNNNLFDVLLKEKRLRLTFRKTDLSNQKYKMIITGKYLGDYLIDCKKPFPLIAKKLSQQNVKILENIDKKITEIDRQIHLLSALKPQNLAEEREAFLKKPNFSPQFIYKSPKSDLTLLLKELNKIPKQLDHPLFHLYKEKIKEIKTKINLMQSINRAELTKHSEKLFGKVDKMLLKQAKTLIKTKAIQEDTSELIKFKDSLQIIEKFLKKNHLAHWKIVILGNATADMQVNKSNTLFIKSSADFTVNRLKALLVHEIETHIYRLENGKLQPFSLLACGTANYLTTEEGLAIYNQNRLNLPLGEKALWSALNVIAVYFGSQMSFLDLFHYLKQNYAILPETAWKLCVKVKRGFCDTNKKFVFTKDIVYFKGENLIKKYLKNPRHQLEDLYIGKIGVEDVEILKKFQNFKIKYLPSKNFVYPL